MERTCQMCGCSIFSLPKGFLSIQNMGQGATAHLSLICVDCKHVNTWAMFVANPISPPLKSVSHWPGEVRP